MHIFNGLKGIGIASYLDRASPGDQLPLHAARATEEEFFDIPIAVGFRALDPMGIPQARP
jgi:hypothetical protein